MVSTGIRSEEQKGGGPYYLRIHGAIYHQIGPLIPEEGEDAVYAQLYIYDTDEGCALRMKNPSKVECTETLMAELTKHVANINPYAQSFKSMYISMQANLDKQRDIRMFIFNDRAMDARRYNLPTTTDVAAVFESPDEGPPSAERHLIIQPFDGPVRT